MQGMQKELVISIGNKQCTLTDLVRHSLILEILLRANGMSVIDRFTLEERVKAFEREQGSLANAMSNFEQALEEGRFD